MKMPVCAQCSTENPDVAKFCLACGSPLTAPTVVDEERKLDTLLFVDMVGSTARAEQLDPEDVLGVLEHYYVRLRAELERYGGTVEKYIGDAVVAHFGVPVAHEDDPERAVRAGFGILEAIGELNAEDPSRDLKVRIGIATGEAIVTLGARVEEGLGIAWCDILNTAARIEGAAPVMGILVGEETYRASAHAIEYRPHDAIEAKGKANPVPVWEAVRVKGALERRLTHEAPLVGRTAELERLVALWERTQAERRPGLATITGDPGIGKSRLLTEFLTGVQEAAAVHWGRCLSYGEGITYWPVEEILKDAAGILQGDDPAVVSAKLGVLLERGPTDDLDQLRTIAVALANLIGAPTTPRGTYSAAEISQAELHWGIRRALELLAAERPLVLVFEDLHWAEPTLLDLIEYLADDEAAAPILLLGSARRELAEIRPSFFRKSENRAAIALTALGEHESAALVAELLGAQGLAAAGRIEALIRNAEGNPLFLEETVGMLVDSGLLDGEGQSSGREQEALPVPTSLKALIGSRLDGLPVQEKRLAQHASVAGTVFWSGAVAHLSGADDDLDSGLDALEQRDFVRAHEVSTVAGDREWAFKHILTRDVAYARVPKGRRIGLHVSFADWISALPGSEDEFVEIVAYHLEQACRLAREVGRSEVAPPVERAVDALARAGEKAERRGGIREADRFYARALELVGDEHREQALDLRLRRGGTLNRLGDLQRADELLSRIADEAPGIGRPDLRAAALIGRANIARKQGRAVEALGHVAESESIAAKVGDRSLHVRAIYEAASVRSRFEDAGEAAVEDLLRGLEIADELDDQALRIEGLVRMVVLLYNLGELAAAEQVLVRCSVLVKDVGSLRDEAQVTFLLGVVKYHLGELEEAERLGLQALEWLERTGERHFQLQNMRTLALCSLARSDLQLAEQRLREAIPLALEGGGWLVVEFYRCLVEVLIRQGRLSEAREL